MAEKKKPRTGPTTWAKGQSGNPGGRSPRVGPNGETIAQLARVHTTEALATLVEICNGKGGTLNKSGITIIEAKDRIQAANAILDRGWGKPKESVDLDANVTGNVIPVIQFVRQPDPE